LQKISLFVWGDKLVNVTVKHFFIAENVRKPLVGEGDYPIFIHNPYTLVGVFHKLAILAF
jgi:hypothetical protein